MSDDIGCKLIQEEPLTKLIFEELQGFRKEIRQELRILIDLFKQFMSVQTRRGTLNTSLDSISNATHPLTSAYEETCTSVQSTNETLKITPVSDMMQKETNHPQKVNKKIFMIPHIKSGVLFINNQSLQAACPEKDLSLSVVPCKRENIRSISPEGKVAQMTDNSLSKDKISSSFYEPAGRNEPADDDYSTDNTDESGDIVEDSFPTRTTSSCEPCVEDDEDKKLTVSCQICSRIFVNNASLKLHLRSHAVVDVGSVKNDGSKSVKISILEKQSNTFSEGDLIKSKNNEPKKRSLSEASDNFFNGNAKRMSYQCEFCDKIFTMASKLDFHVKHQHSDNRYLCKHCDKSYNKKVDAEMN
ncbi:unnamed protein product [Clavelina lepadiformis]|uniref:C2H2-type domain-containing protein n=1 Tax=Clavelina lepadiformis TaxID=159417 RepID=A0ABP0GKU7_CLALP